jgi:hypothetical protein
MKCTLMSYTSRGQYRRIKGRYELKKAVCYKQDSDLFSCISTKIRCDLHTVTAPLPYQNTQAVYKARDKNAKLYTE